MNSTQPVKFPLLQEMLLLEDSADHDIMGGVKKVLSDIGNNWGKGTRDVKTGVVKKLDPAVARRVQLAMRAFFNSALSDLSRTPSFSMLTNETNKNTAKPISAILLDLGNASDGSLLELGRNFVNSADLERYDGVEIIDSKTVESSITLLQSPTIYTLSPENVALFADANNKTFFLDRVLKLDDQFDIDTAGGAELLIRKLRETVKIDPAKGKEAVISTVRGLQRLRLLCLDAQKAVAAMSNKQPRTPTGTPPAAP